ncbi:MAG: methyltransferase domain-containing protein, partial [Gammaproteobacteria bacterium]|nr:methyltransferase domain-containing protein [Gammaproteobacteria bacterium]
VASEGITLDSPCDVHDLPGFSEGLISVQDGAAQLAASLLSLKPGLRVLDACCAPGGKTCHILESEAELLECVALDVDAKRLKRVKENLSRLDLETTLVQGDALVPQTWWDGQLFDRILLDAPCSATGVIRRHSDIKLLRTNEEVLAVSDIQKSMLNVMWPLLAPGGLMVYATCSVIAEENELQIAAFLASHPDCRIKQDHQIWGRATGHGQQILPGEQGMDGFFYSVLIKG